MYRHRVAVTMDHAEISIKDKNHIEIMLDSQMEINILKEIVNDLRSFIAQALENNNFELSFAVNTNKNVRTKRPYTAHEKYKKMEEKNPLIREIKNTLGFELDY